MSFSWNDTKSYKLFYKNGKIEGLVYELWDYKGKLIDGGLYNETEYKRRLRFTRLPEKCKITIYTVTGEKVREINHDSIFDGSEWWDLRSYNNQEVAPGLYIYVIEADNAKKIDKFAIIR